MLKRGFAFTYDALLAATVLLVFLTAFTLSAPTHTTRIQPIQPLAPQDAAALHILKPAHTADSMELTQTPSCTTVPCQAACVSAIRFQTPIQTEQFCQVNP
ncbi:MAG: hypothetical protein HY917_04665 [Candidatus Diapherotrites archaeon]|nr:hypothetical protein [Candidatus Diapherotrites archaeon]